MNTLNETILITGATGFLGSHLLKGLIKNGYKVIILKRSTSNTWRISEIVNDVYSYDIDLESLNHVFINHNIDVIIHTATKYGRGNEKLSEILEANIELGIQLLEKAEDFSINTFINTDTFYNTGDCSYNQLNEYVLSKKQFVEWCKLYSRKSGIKVINLKLQHIYGPLDNKDKFVNWLINELHSNRKEIKLTKGEQERDFIYIYDVIQAYLSVLQNRKQLKKKYTNIDVGSGKVILLKDFIEIVYHAVNQYKPTTSKLSFGALPYREGEIMQISEDIKQLVKFGWEPKVELKDGIEIVINSIY